MFKTMIIRMKDSCIRKKKGHKKVNHKIRIRKYMVKKSV